MRILVTGGAASGKSAFAEKRTCELGDTRTYIATMLVRGSEDAARVIKHQNERAGKGFTTFEITRAADLEQANNLFEYFINLFLKGYENISLYLFLPPLL